jgi:hypothetical protein
MCAGPYGLRLMGIPEATARELEQALMAGEELLRYRGVTLANSCYLAYPPDSPYCPPESRSYASIGIIIIEEKLADMIIACVIIATSL